MQIYRITREKYANSIKASGKAARWNEDQQWVVYASQSRSLATLELLVHRAAIHPGIAYKVMVIKIGDNHELFKEIDLTDLPQEWRKVMAYPALQKIGSSWYHSLNSLILKVPSVIIPQESNYIINTRHPGFQESISLMDIEDYFWDERIS